MPKDYPRDEIMRQAKDAVQRYGGPRFARVYFKFTCEDCGERCMFQEPDTLYEEGECDNCHHKTVIREAGFALHIGELPPARPPDH